MIKFWAPWSAHFELWQVWSEPPSELYRSIRIWIWIEQHIWSHCAVQCNFAVPFNSNLGSSRSSHSGCCRNFTIAEIAIYWSWKIILNQKFDAAPVSKSSLEFNTVLPTSSDMLNRILLPFYKPRHKALTGLKLTNSKSQILLRASDGYRLELMQPNPAAAGPDCSAEASPGRAVMASPIVCCESLLLQP